MVQKILVTRNEVRQMGLDVSNTTFNRWEEAGLLRAFKPNGRSSIVRYRIREVLKLMVRSTR